LENWGGRSIIDVFCGREFSEKLIDIYKIYYFGIENLKELTTMEIYS
jgi:hypothetical protein